MTPPDAALVAASAAVAAVADTPGPARRPLLSARAALDALALAALALPGIVCNPAQAQDSAADDSVAVQAAHHRESRRALAGLPHSATPLRADSLQLQGSRVLDGRHTLQLGWMQDTWSGATPVTTAPAVAQGNRAVQAGAAGQLVTVGASPMLTGRVMLDAQDRPVQADAQGRWQAAPALVHTLSSASPETRQQLDARLVRRSAEGALTVGAGVSLERDHLSRHASLGQRLDRGSHSLSWGLAATHGQTRAALDHDAAPYITKTAAAAQIVSRNSQQVLLGRRDEWVASGGLTQLLSPSAVLATTWGYTHSRGDLGNPYKLVSVVFAPDDTTGADGVRSGDLRALLEQRPRQRRQLSLASRLVLHHAGSDGALHLGLGHVRDDWGVRAWRVDGEWFQPLAGDGLLSLRLRYHTQSAARFYTPWLVQHQAYRRVNVAPDGQLQVRSFDPGLLPAAYTSDQRLSAHGVLGLGLGWTQRFARGLSLDVSVDHARHAGRLRAGGGGEAAFADLRHLSAQATLRLAFDALAFNTLPSGTRTSDTRASAPRAADDSRHDHDHSPGHGGAHGALVAPPDVAAGHVSAPPGTVMLGVRQTRSRSSAVLLQGRRRVDDSTVKDQACGSNACVNAPTQMSMRMHMLDLMLALDERWTLMLMPQFMTMAMDSRLLPGAVAGDTPVHVGRHESAGLGDTAVHALATLHDSPTQRVVLGLGLSVPTGRTDLRHRRSHQQDGAALDVAMQPGSGTWDLLPSASWLAGRRAWSWGVAAQAALRLQSANEDGYAWGPRWQADTWLARRISPAWAGLLRARWRQDGRVVGEHRGIGTPVSPPEASANHGGQVLEAGAGLQLDGPGLDGDHSSAGGQRHSRLALEWLHTVAADLRGVQLQPRSRWTLSLVTTW